MWFNSVCYHPLGTPPENLALVARGWRVFSSRLLPNASVNSSSAHPPPGQPSGISIFFLNGKFLGVGINKSVKYPRLGPKGRQMPHPRVHLERTTAPDLINHNKKVSLIVKTIKAGFHIIAMIAAIAGKNVQQSL